MADTADTVALTNLTGFVGHQGACGCHIQCGAGGHHKPGMGTYYPMATHPSDCEDYPLGNCTEGCKVPDNCRHPDVDLETLTVDDPQQYLANL